MKKRSNQLVSHTNQLKLLSPDGKRYKTDVVDASGVKKLTENFPNNKATDFLDWFTYSDNTIDGQTNSQIST